MDSIEVTKVSTAVLVAGIAYFLTGLIGANIVSPERPAKPAIEISRTELRLDHMPTTLTRSSRRCAGCRCDSWWDALVPGKASS